MFVKLEKGRIINTDHIVSINYSGAVYLGYLIGYPNSIDLTDSDYKMLCKKLHVQVDLTEIELAQFAERAINTLGPIELNVLKEKILRKLGQSVNQYQGRQSSIEQFVCPRCHKVMTLGFNGNFKCDKCSYVKEIVEGSNRDIVKPRETFVEGEEVSVQGRPNLVCEILKFEGTRCELKEKGTTHTAWIELDQLVKIP